MNNGPISRIWLWQRIFSPHMGDLAVALAARGCEVVYVAVEAMTPDRVAQGWTLPKLPGVRMELAPSIDAALALVASAPVDSIHLCSGIRGHGLIGSVQHELSRLNLRQWLVVETVDDAGWRGMFKRFVYGRLLRKWRQLGDGVLAIGASTPVWLAARGIPPERIFPFAYFLPHATTNLAVQPLRSTRVRVLFVGQFIELKRVDVLIGVLGRLTERNFELAVVGSGPLEQQLRHLAERELPGRVDWVGRLPLVAVPAEMARADCLVLPSRHDGWGAVVSEALMVGTPVICSDACGSAGVVLQSKQGGTFPVNDTETLSHLLDGMISSGPLNESERARLASWASCLGGRAGADYLLEILEHVYHGKPRPMPPWVLARDVA